MAEFGLMRGEFSEAVHDGQTEYNANLLGKLKWNWNFNIQVEAQRAQAVF
jgi:hypothetical protein